MNFLLRHASALFFLFGMGIGIIFSHSSDSIGSTTIQPNKNSHGNEIFTSEKIKSVEKIIQDSYYHFSEKPKVEIENEMITSLVGSLGDKHSSYFPPKEAKEFSEVLNGDFEGIGAVIDEHIRGIIIKKVFDTSPAKKAGLQDGDVILKVGNDSMLGMRADEAVKKIRGPKGSKVLLTYTRGENSKPITVEVTRDTIDIPSVQEVLLTGSLSDVGYIEVAFFGERTPKEFQKAFTHLTSSGAKAIILDFRDNGGGYLDAAVDVLSLLLPDNTLAVTTKENDPSKTEPLFTKSSQNTNTKIPLVMLVNNLSASATEIVAGALQDNKRAIIIGEQTYGKGSVQEPFVLEDGSILKLTIAKWYTPEDKNIDKNGITPDVIIPLFDRDFTTRYDRQLENAKKIIDSMISTNASRESILADLKNKDFTQ